MSGLGWVLLAVFVLAELFLAVNAWQAGSSRNDPRNAAEEDQ